MISSAGVVHIATLFAIVVIMVTEIKLGKDQCSWLPILTTLVGYLLPQPKFSGSKKKRTSSSMLHLDPDFAPMQNSDGAESAADRSAVEAVGSRIEKQTETKSYRTLFLESLPSMALFTAVAVWATISMTSSDILPPSTKESTTAPVPSVWQSSAAALTIGNGNAKRFGSSTACEYLLSTSNLNKMCSEDGGLEHTVEITNGTLGMCYLKNRSIGAKIQLQNSTFISGYTGWRLLLFRMSRISDRLHKTICYEMSLGYRNQTASSCNDRVIITGYPSQTTLSAQQWNEIVFYIPDVMLAMLGCQPYTSAEPLD
jgi:hypothetical protein